MNPKLLLDRFLGPQTGPDAVGLLGLLMENKKTRKKIGSLGGGFVRNGGAAALGVLAHNAYRNWQNQNAQRAPAAAHAANGGGLSAASPTAVGRDGRPFQLALVRAMISAANADGHQCEEEHETIISQLSFLNLDVDDKSFLSDVLTSPSSLEDIAGLADGVEQAIEIYLVSRMAIDVDDPAERDYLDSLARRMGLPAGLVLELETQVMKRAIEAA